MLLVSLECRVARWNLCSVYWYLRHLYLDIPSTSIDAPTGPNHAESRRHSLALSTICSHLKSRINSKCMIVGAINLINTPGLFDMIEFMILKVVPRSISIHIPIRLNFHKKAHFILELHINLRNNEAPQKRILLHHLLKLDPCIPEKPVHNSLLLIMKFKTADIHTKHMVFELVHLD